MVAVVKTEGTRYTRGSSEKFKLLAVKWLMLWLIVIVLCLVDLVPNASSECIDNSSLPNAPAVKLYRRSGDKHKLIVAADVAQRQHELVLGDSVQVLADYGSFQLLQVDAEALDRFNDEPAVQLTDAFNIIWLRNGPFDSTHGAPEVVEALRQPVVIGPRLHLIQFVGPVKDEWLAARQAGGAPVVSYWAQNAYVVWADEAALNSIQKLKQEAVIIQWDGPYHPAYKLHPALSKLSSSDYAEVEVAIQLINHPGVDETVSAIEQLASAIVSDPFPVLKYINMRVRIPAKALEPVAPMGDVFDIEPWTRPPSMDERQGQIVAGNMNATGTQPFGPGYWELSIQYMFDGDLTAFLVSPSGARLRLFSHVGGRGRNFTNTIFDDGASLPIRAESAPLTDMFQPRGTLQRFVGETAAGQWTLRIKDVMPNQVTSTLTG